MNFELKQLSLASAAKTSTDTLIVLISKHFKAGQDPLSALIAKALQAKDLSTQAGNLLSAYALPGVKASKILLVGVGDAKALDLKLAVNAAVAVLKTSKSANAVVVFSEPTTAEALQTTVLTLADASYVYTQTKSKPVPRHLKQVALGLLKVSSTLEQAFAKSVAMVQGIEFAKEWANRPANHATPSMLAKAAQTLAKDRAVSCEVLGPQEVAKLGMRSFMAVAQGSAEPLRFIVLKYQGAAKTQAPTVLVGKGITFDSGGIALKPGPEMDEMKFDMGGAASVLGVFKSLSLLKPAVNLIGLIPACENMPDGNAIKPGDVVTSMSGQTIEILNPDAEGRLILCDALTYAERFKPKAVIDIATLTGACVIALGAVRSGLFASDDDLAAALQKAGDEALDLCWRMPLDDAYADTLKSNFADMANVGGRPGGAIIAAKFLQRFAQHYPWAHLDIAATAWKGGAAKGATGRPVGLLLNYVLSLEASGKTKVAAKP
jgi:leucyl aminopeptidase